MVARELQTHLPGPSSQLRGSTPLHACAQHACTAVLSYLPPPSPQAPAAFLLKVLGQGQHSHLPMTHLSCMLWPWLSPTQAVAGHVGCYMACPLPAAPCCLLQHQLFCCEDCAAPKKPAASLSSCLIVAGPALQRWRLCCPTGAPARSTSATMVATSPSASGCSPRLLRRTSALSTSQGGNAPQGR